MDIKKNPLLFNSDKVEITLDGKNQGEYFSEIKHVVLMPSLLTAWVMRVFGLIQYSHSPASSIL